MPRATGPAIETWVAMTSPTLASHLSTRRLVELNRPNPVGVKDGLAYPQIPAVLYNVEGYSRPPPAN